MKTGDFPMTNKRIRRFTLLISGFLLLTACGINVGPSVTHCRDWDELTPDEQNSIESTSIELLQNISMGNFDQVWLQMHPSLQAQLSKERFKQTMTDVQLRLKKAERIELVDGRLATVNGAKSVNQNIICGVIPVEDPSHLRLTVQVPTDKVAVAILRAPGGPLERKVSVQLAQDNGTYKIAGLHISSAAYQNRDAADYAEVGAEWIDEGKYVSGYLAYAMAMNLSYRSGFLQTGQYATLSEKFRSLNQDDKIQKLLRTWRIGGHDYQLVRVSLIETLGDISPHIAYLSNGDLDEETTSVEAHQLMQYIEREYPELREAFDSVLFEAFSEMPSDPKKTYPGYRVALHFE